MYFTSTPSLNSMEAIMENETVFRQRMSAGPELETMKLE